MPSVAKFARLNLKGLTILWIKKTRTWDATVVTYATVTMWNSLGQCHQDQNILLTHHCAYPIPGFLASSSYPVIELQIFPYLKNLLLYVLIDAWCLD